eukprot:138116-Prorocentrum_minimum.AAC.1
MGLVSLNITSLNGSSCANNGNDALNTPETLMGLVSLLSPVSARAAALTLLSSAAGAPSSATTASASANRFTTESTAGAALGPTSETGFSSTTRTSGSVSRACKSTRRGSGFTPTP